MASTSFGIDGSLRQFQLGQSILDPGLERTGFGVPLNCAAVPQTCLGDSTLWHYTWGFQPRGAGGTIGVMHQVSEFDSFGSFLMASINVTVRCSSSPDPPFPLLPTMFIETVLDVQQYWLIEILDGGTTWSFGVTPTSSPSSWVARLHFLPGP